VIYKLPSLLAYLAFFFSTCWTCVCLVVTIIIELSVKSPCLVFGPPFTPYPLFQWYPQSKKIYGSRWLPASVQAERWLCSWLQRQLVNQHLRSGRQVRKFYQMKFWNSAFNAQASRVNVVVVQARENICSKSGGAQKKGKTVYVLPKLSFCEFQTPPRQMLVYFFAGFFLISPMYGQTQDSSAVFSLL
jgi:hypothetical protein